LSRKLFPAHHRHSLDSLITRYGIRVNDRHRALADARVLWDLWQHWSALLPAQSFSDTVAELVGRPELPPQIDPCLIDDLPEAPGAYAFFSGEGKLLLSKRCANIRQQVLSHFSPKSLDTALVRDTVSIEWKETAGEFGARMGELELASSTRKPLDELCSWQLVQHNEGHFQPELVFASSIDFASTPDLFGLYMRPCSPCANWLKRITCAIPSSVLALASRERHALAINRKPVAAPVWVKSHYRCTVRA
ncbi:MAG: hypothetical protein J0653_04630, partial [Deltaproteobacteria bacterium]|nr:hypothetical protein [Deltaproteobacteria bacterium]